ncbi:autophagy protein 5 [Linnemannia gamsii]|uniref:Autophagy protein 5 n=1 Tax=Linnemannia gamsii TaxID=64522 RepID=A0A9P6QYN6_9FUNG|nr:autophagy protein 5 [Linnemannia gamsii]
MHTTSENPVAKVIWEGSIPIQFVWDPTETQGRTLEPYFIRRDFAAKRLGFPSDESEMWFDYEGIPLKWYVSAHRVGGVEADYLRNGSTKKVMNMSKSDQTQLWEGLWSKSYDQFWGMNQRLVSNDGALARHLPVRIYLPENCPVIQDLVSPQDEDGAMDRSDGKDTVADHRKNKANIGRLRATGATDTLPTNKSCDNRARNHDGISGNQYATPANTSWNTSGRRVTDNRQSRRKRTQFFRKERRELLRSNQQYLQLQSLLGKGHDYRHQSELQMNRTHQHSKTMTDRRLRDDDDGTDGDHTDKDDDGSSQDDDGSNHDESGPLREQIKQLQLEDVLAFLPVGGTSASGMLQRPADDVYQRRTASGEKMPFQLDDELANLGTKSLEEILGHDGGDEDDGDKVKGIRFKDTITPSQMRGLGREGDSPTKIRISPERSGPNSQKSSAHNSVGSSFSDLSDSSVTQSAMEDAYLSGYNNSKISLFMHASTRN